MLQLQVAWNYNDTMTEKDLKDRNKSMQNLVQQKKKKKKLKEKRRNLMGK